MEKLQKDAFFKKYKNSEENFSKANLKWEDLMDIYEDYSSNYKSLSIISNYVFETLTELPTVHSIRRRIKDPEHLIEKIIRKSAKKPELGINLQNYTEKITDLIGVRVLHLYKGDWIDIHKKIINTWELAETPTANIRKGDSEDIYIENGCNIENHKYGYRSVHYLVKFPCTKDSSKIVEIQVRTLFEEAWSEIDHSIRYPYDTDNAILAGYLVVFNSLAGSADQMGSFIKILKQELELRNQAMEEKDRQINELEEKVGRMELKAQDKDEIAKSLNKIKFDKDKVSLLYSSVIPMDFDIIKAINSSSKELRDILLSDESILRSIEGANNGEQKE